MDATEFLRNFPSDQPVPERLQLLLEFQNKAREWYSGHFELAPWQYGNAAWFDGDQDAAKQFVVFGQGGDGSLYALWLYPGRTLADAPVVFLGSEGSDCGLLADDFDAFLGLLAVGADELGFAVSWGSLSDSQTSAPRLVELRNWLYESAAIAVPSDPLAVVANARPKHPDFGEWLAEWGRLHFRS